MYKCVKRFFFPLLCSLTWTQIRTHMRKHIYVYSFIEMNDTKRGDRKDAMVMVLKMGK